MGNDEKRICVSGALQIQNERFMDRMNEETAMQIDSIFGFGRG